MNPTSMLILKTLKSLCIELRIKINRKMNKSVLFFIVLFMAGHLVYSQSKDDRFKEVKAQKVAYLTEKMNLTIEESKSFWPIYNEYEQSMRELRGQRWQKEENLTEENAKKALISSLEREEKEIHLKRDFYKKVTSVVSYQKLYLLEKSEREFRKKLFERYKHDRRRK